MKPGPIRIKYDLFQIMRVMFYLSVLYVGVFYCIESRFSMNPDGISYIDIAYAYSRGEWQDALNAYWSPLYSWIIALFLFLFSPGPESEFQLVHAINFLILIFTLTGFDFFLRELLLRVRNRNNLLFAKNKSTLKENSSSSSSTALFIVLPAYALFIKIVFDWIGLANVTPDLLLCGTGFWIYGVLIRIKGAGSLQKKSCLIYGALLGAAYLAKSVMFPLSAFFLIVLVDFESLWSSRDHLTLNLFLDALKPFWVSSGIFVLVSLPFVLAISTLEGKLTFGESGRINYAICVNQYINYIHLKGINGAEKMQINPPAILHESPEVAAYSIPVDVSSSNPSAEGIYSIPVKGTYPLYYNPVYWLRGIEPQLNLIAQWRVLKENIVKFFKMVWGDFGVMILFFTIMHILSLTQISAQLGSGIKDNYGRWIEFLPLFLPAVAGLLIYLPVYVLPRYSGLFVALLILLLIVSVPLPAQTTLVRGVAGVLMLLISCFMVQKSVVKSFHLLQPQSLMEMPHKEMARARALHRSGVSSGDYIGVIGAPYAAYWARLARVIIIADIFEYEKRDGLNRSEDQKKILEAFQRAGAQSVVLSHSEGEKLLPEGWRDLDHTGLSIYHF
ncbi:MAG: hypothetical protein HQK65_08610 [Desulfamplus sp.]|nr:hypothetical protein [Desulfamplus sp.]